MQGLSARRAKRSAPGGVVCNVQASWRKSEGRVEVEPNLVSHRSAQARLEGSRGRPALSRRRLRHRAVNKNSEARAWAREGKLTLEDTNSAELEGVDVRVPPPGHDLVNLPGPEACKGASVTGPTMITSSLPSLITKLASPSPWPGT